MNGKARGSILGICLVGVLALTPFRAIKVTGHSMEPTLHDGETYLLDQFYWKSSGMHRGDLIAIRHGGDVWVKRLIGMPGDHLRIARMPDGWIVAIQNVTSGLGDVPPRGLIEEHQDGPDEVYVIGDNLNHSEDSTHQEAGAFHYSDIIGVVRHFTLSRSFPFHRHA